MKRERGVTTVLTVVYSANDLTTVRKNLESVSANTDDPRDVVVVMNGVQADVRRYLWSVFGRAPYVTLVDFKRNVGLASGLNAGLAVAKGDVIVTLASDVTVLGRWLERDWVETLRGVLDSGYDAAALSYNTHGDVEFFRSMDYWCLSLTCCAYRTRVFDELGTFDERFDPYGFEDEDMGMRLELAKKKRVFVTGGRFPIFHPEPSYGDGTDDAIADAKLKHNESGVAKFVSKWVEKTANYKFERPLPESFSVT